MGRVVDIYDRDGKLLAHSVEKLDTLRHQFVDPSGYLLATVESPGIGTDVPPERMPRDAGRGNVLPFHIRFERPGYALASRLLDPEFRWVLAQAAQTRAILEAAEYTAEAQARSGSWGFHRDYLGNGVVQELRGRLHFPTVSRRAVAVTLLVSVIFFIFLGCCGLCRVVWADQDPGQARKPTWTAFPMHQGRSGA